MSFLFLSWQALKQFSTLGVFFSSLKLFEPRDYRVVFFIQEKRTSFRMSVFCGGDKRDRTADLLNAIAPEVLDSVEVA